MSILDRSQRSGPGDILPFKSNLGLIAGLAMATAGFVALLVYYW